MCILYKLVFPLILLLTKLFTHLAVGGRRGGGEGFLSSNIISLYEVMLENILINILSKVDICL